VAGSQQDTLAGKVSRFVFGAIGGAISGWFYMPGSVGTIAVFAVIGGLMAMLLGGVLMKRVFRSSGRR
jgi:amino acid transporter